jgi:hypothetical protein
MGTIGEAFKAAFELSYRGQFRFSAELGKGLAIGESGIPIEFLDVFGSGRGLDLGSTDDQAIAIKLAQARQFRNVNIWFNFSGEVQKAVLELMDLQDMKKPFFVSIAVQKDIKLKRAELYVLRDNQATLHLPPIPISDENFKVRMYRLELTLKAPELLHAGHGLSLQKV